MHERIVIENFAGIKKLDMSLAKINIIIGPQASGKSITAKLLFFFKDIFQVLLGIVMESNNAVDLNEKLIKNFLEYFPLESWGNGTFSIRYEYRQLYVIVKKEKENDDTLTIKFSEYFEQLLEKAAEMLQSELDVAKKTPLEQISQPGSLIVNMVGKVYQWIASEIDPTLAYTGFYIPAGRSFFSNLQSIIFSMLQANTEIDPFIRKFGALYETLKGFEVIKDTDERMSLDSHIETILCGTYLKEKNKEYIISTDNRKIRLHNSSSGQQESLPLALTLKALGKGSNFSTMGQTVYIEEPEAHLFPTAQKLIVELTAMTFNLNKNTQFIITTHSPYILTAFNTLLLAGKTILDNPEKKEEVLKVMDEQVILEPLSLQAYSLSQEETSCIISGESGLIEGDLIDSVSDELAAEFNALLDIEYQE